jgi:predicted nucleotidyltransferase
VTACANAASSKNSDKRLRDIVDQLHDTDAIAVLLFGSMARGDQDSQSDVDVLVVVDDNKRRSDVLSVFRARPSNDSHVPLVLTVQALREEAREHPSFVAHLLDEGTLLLRRPAWDNLRQSLASCAFDSAALAREVRHRARHLEPLLRSERFRNSPVTALSHLYGIARSLVIIRLLENGIHEYSWQRAFDRYAEIRPELRSTLDEIKQLRDGWTCPRSLRRC